MTSDTTRSPDSADQALRRFEISVEVPCVPGEMERWAASVAESWEQLRGVITRLLHAEHPTVYEDIQREDRGLFRRVTEMQREDSKIERLASELDARIPRLQSVIAAAEPDEARVRPALEAFVADAIAFVIRLRRQRLAVRTWLMEAFLRDRGTVD